MQYQVNLFGTQTKNVYKYLFSFGGWILLFIVLWFKGCAISTPQLATIKTKEIIKTLPADTIVKHEVINVEKIVKDRTNEKKLSKDILEMYERIEAYQNEVDELHDFYKFADSIQKDSIFKLLTELKNFESNFEDENLILKLKGIIAKNEVKEITPTYTIKAKTIQVPQLKFRLLAGGGLGNSVTFDKPLFYGNLGFQNSKGNVLNFSFDSEQRILVGYNFSVFKISK